MKKTIIAVVVLMMLCIFTLSAQQAQDRAGIMLTHFAPRQFAAGAIPRADLDLIVQAGVRAPSANNSQPWHFTVVQNIDLARRMVSQVVEGNVLIVVSTARDTNTWDIIGCALATESMYLTAQTLGHSSRIYTGPIAAINRDLKGELSLPAGHSAVTLVRVGKVDPSIDARTAATPRKAASEVVTYR